MPWQGRFGGAAPSVRRRSLRAAMWTSGSAQTIVACGQRCLIASRRRDAGADQLMLEPADAGPARRGGNNRLSTAHDRKLISFSGQTSGGRLLTDCCTSSAASANSVKSLGKVRGGLVDTIGRAIVEQVPDDLKPTCSAASSAGSPARPVVLARRLLDQMPAQAVADGAEAELGALPIVAEHMLVVAGRADQVEANAVTPPVRRTFKAGLEEAGECPSAHGRHQCAKSEMEPSRPQNRHDLARPLAWRQAEGGTIVWE